MAKRPLATAGMRQESARLVSDGLREAVEARLRFGLTYAEIARELEDEEKAGRLAHAPAERTIRSWVATGKVRRPAGPREPWSVASGRADEVAFVVPVLRDLVRIRPDAPWPSIREAEIITRIRRVADVPGVIALTLAGLYVERERRHESTEELDLYLAFAPWRDEEANKEYIVIANSSAGRFRALWVSQFEPGRVTVGVNATVGVSVSAVRRSVL